MTLLEKFKQISRVSGVDQYMLVDPAGNIAVHDIKNPEKTANMIFSCGKNSAALAKTQFKYMVFSRKNQKNVFIFPVGNYYLGVVKSKNTGDGTLTDNIIKFLKDLDKKRDQ